ncbi:MAG: PDZ domain-containing protein [Anaerolineae bacterium]|nr:PDZ domain-containing protein [Anaerolineae bacterium]
MPRGLIVAHVQQGSIAAKMGLRVGDEIIAVGGQPIRDVIDYYFYTAEESFEITYRREGKQHTALIKREYGMPLGLDFDSPTTDGIRRCNNDCPFCFIHQMPPGLRRSLYIRDDVYRYSFFFAIL